MKSIKLKDIKPGDKFLLRNKISAEIMLDKSGNIICETYDDVADPYTLYFLRTLDEYENIIVVDEYGKFTEGIMTDFDVVKKINN